MKIYPWLELIKGDMKSADTEEVVLLLSEPVGGSWDGGMTAKNFGETLASISKVKPVALHINSLGGRVDDGIAMYNMIRARGNVNTVVIGYAASMGSIIAQAGAVRKMMPGTMMMIHNPYVLTQGDHKELEKTSKNLLLCKNNLVDVYSTHNSKISKKRISELMDETTVMAPKDAVELGFADEAPDGTPAWNEIEPTRFMHAFKDLLPRPAAPQTKTNKPMKLILAALAALIKLPEDATDESAAPQVATALGNLIVDRDNLKTMNQKHEDAKKLRVTNRVQAAIDGKLIKAERLNDLVAAGIANEATLDFLSDIVAPTVTPPKGQMRGAPVPAPEPGTEDTQEAVRGTLKTARTSEEALEVGIANANAARKLRTLRGHGDLFKS